jgi:hypothetical protein
MSLFLFFPDELACPVQGLEPARIAPVSVEDRERQLALPDVIVVDVGDLQLALPQ